MLLHPEKNPSLPSLLAPEIPGAIPPAPPSQEWGINRAAAQTNFPEPGLKIQIPIWAAKGLGDKELAVIKMVHAFIADNLDDSIALAYTIKRKAGGTDGPLDPTVYDVRKVVAPGTLKVMGARFNRSTYRASSASRVLSAFDANTGQPLQAEWKYPVDTQWTTTSTWRDSRPDQPLQVRTTDDQVTLNPANIIGNGIDTTVTGLAAFIAHRDVGDVVGWGNAQYGAAIPSTIITMDDIVEVSCTRSAYAARRANSAVVVWGTAAEGGSMTGISPLDFKQVVANGTAFTGLKNTNQVVGWGGLADGGEVPANIGELTNIDRVVGAGQAFAALTADGRIVTWGHAGGGGDSSAVQDRLRGKVSYQASPVTRGLALKADRLAQTSR